MKYKQLYHILDYGQHLSCGGRNECGICYKKRRKKFKHALEWFGMGQGVKQGSIYHHVHSMCSPYSENGLGWDKE